MPARTPPEPPTRLSRLAASSSSLRKACDVEQLLDEVARAARLVTGASQVAIGPASPPPSLDVGRQLAARIGEGPAALGWVCLTAREDGEPFDSDDEEALYIVCDVAALVDARIREHLAAQSADRKLSTLVEQMPGVTYSRELDQPGAPFFISSQAEALTGLPPAAFVADPDLWRRSIHEDDRARVLAEQSRFDPDAVNAPIWSSYRIHHQDGSVRWVDNHVRVLRDEAGKPVFVMGMIFDVTERRAAEQRSQRTRELERVRTLAAGIAHEFNNQLATITAQCSFIQTQLDAASTIGGSVDEIAGAALRVATLTSELAAFTCQDVAERELVDLGALVCALEPKLSASLDPGVALHVRVGDAPCPVLASRTQIEHVVSNLVSNAAHALARGGSVWLDLATSSDSRVILSVRDDGVGMSEETRSRVFEPFFTTRERARGMGLGLSSALGIVEQCGGTIAVESTIGEGTTFRVELPLASASRAVETKAASKAETRGAKTILVVDDDDSVRRVVVRILRSKGYDVLEASNPSSALDEYEREHERVALVVTDYMMPGMTGKDLHARMHERAPVPVLFISGYTGDFDLRLGAGHAVLAKPFTSDKLVAAVQSAFDAAT